MGAALAEAALAAGHEVVIVSGPVEVRYPPAAEVIPVVSTREMLDACLEHFDRCDGLIATAAPCDYGPAEYADHKIEKTGDRFHLELVETPDIAAALGREKDHHWIVCFALETRAVYERAARKLERKNGDLIVINGPEAISGEATCVEVMAPGGEIVGRFDGTKGVVAERLVGLIEGRLIGESPN